MDLPEAQPVVADSARRHGIDREGLMHAFRNPIRILELEEGFTMVIGPDQAGDLLEVGVVQGATAPVIVHAMRAREKFLR